MSSKKVPYHKHREAEEARKKREEDEAARVYAEFVESFKGDSSSGAKFIRGGVIDPNAKLKTDSEGGKSKDGGSVPKKGSRYVPSFLPPSFAKEPEKKKEGERPKEKEKEKGKPRVIDRFLEEIKLEQEQREKRHQDRDHRREGRHGDSSMSSSRFDELPDEFDPTGRFPGSFDDGDPQTTNLYVGNLSPKVDENFLLRTFGRFGPIASVKIMWPRTEEERRRQRNCGFVAFMNRTDGQAAKDEMQGVIVYDYELKIGWGKSVALPSQALPAPPPGHMAIRNKEGGTATVILSGPGGPAVASIKPQTSELVLTPNVPDIVVAPPDDGHLRHVIDTMALHVLDGGCAFEQAVMERGRGNPLFDFLFNLKSKEHTYYVWRLYSFAQGDTLQRWRTEPYIMITGSGRWVPPPLSSNRSPEREKESTFAAGRSRRVEVERTLTDSQRDEFEDMLRALTLERSQIKDAMGFALDNADAAGEIVEVLTESLTLKETSIPTKVARLMLVSDILHNSSAPVKNASAFRTKFEASLPDVMESFNDLYRSITGRITAEALKERVMKVLQVWADWFLFSDAFLNGLRATFLRSGNSGVVPFHSLCGDAPEIEKKGSSEDGNDGFKLNEDGALATGKAAATKELLGLPLAELERRCRHNGLSLCGGKEMMVARLLNLEEAEKERIYEKDVDVKYVQGEQHVVGREDSGVNAHSTSRFGEGSNGDELDVSRNSMRAGKGRSGGSASAELESFPSKKPKYDPVLPASKWSREDDISDDEDRKGGRGLGLSYSQKLRQIEISVMQYRESLEEQGLRDLDEIERKVASHRRRLQSEYGLSTPTDGANSRRSSGTHFKQYSILQKEHHRRRSGKRGMAMHMIILGNVAGARVEAAVLQGSLRRGIESTIAVGTEIGYARKVQAEGETTTTTEAEIERTGERGGDRPEKPRHYAPFALTEGPRSII
ncbi:Protein RRC1 [Zea mays]|uniref:Protein RRC1 n=1 Tax=Zea mays TaxID=4577 RepID=A0A1D6H2G5_MAIZE|nr:Protein RRC1 [Zea mays]AQK69050.1 Protein RRC1 [Zea mays]